MAALIVAIFAFGATAQELALSLPLMHTSNDGGLSYYTEGSSVKVSWTTQYDHTTLSVFQQQGTGGYDAINLLAASYPRSQTSFTWKATAVSSSGSLSGPFHFFIQNSANATCQGCFLNSPKFAVHARIGSSSSVAASSSISSATVGVKTSKPTGTSTHPKFTSVSTNNAGPGAATAGAAGSRSSATPLALQNKGHKTDLAIPLGVGLGAGIPALLILIAIAFMFCLRRRRKSQDSEKDEKAEPAFVAAPKQSPETSGTSTWSHSRSSMYSPEPLPEVAEKQETGAAGVWPGQPLRHSASHSPRGAHQYRPSMAPTQEETREETPQEESEDAHSYAAPLPPGPTYLDSFDFEEPLPVELDATNEVPRSGGSSNYSRPSRQSSGNEGHTLEDPQHVHDTYLGYGAEQSWPLPAER